MSRYGRGSSYGGIADRRLTVAAQCPVPIGRDAWALARLASLDVLHQLERVLLYVGDEAADEGRRANDRRAFTPRTVPPSPGPSPPPAAPGPPPPWPVSRWRRLASCRRS